MAVYSYILEAFTSPSIQGKSRKITHHILLYMYIQYIILIILSPFNSNDSSVLSGRGHLPTVGKQACVLDGQAQQPGCRAEHGTVVGGHNPTHEPGVSSLKTTSSPSTV